MRNNIPMLMARLMMMLWLWLIITVLMFIIYAWPFSCSPVVGVRCLAFGHCWSVALSTLFTLFILFALPLPYIIPKHINTVTYWLWPYRSNSIPLRAVLQESPLRSCQSPSNRYFPNVQMCCTKVTLNRKGLRIYVYKVCSYVLFFSRFQFVLQIVFESFWLVGWPQWAINCFCI